MENRAVLLGLALCFSITCLGCGAAQPEVEEPEAEEMVVEELTAAMVQRSLVNDGCFRVEILESVRLERPEGLLLVMTAEVCEGFEEQGLAAFLVAAVGNEHLQENTMHVLPGINGAHAEAVQVVTLEARRASANGPSVAYLRYRVPPDAGEGDDFMERVIVGTFSASALELAVVQPVHFSVAVGRGRMQGEGSVELVDSDDDGDLDLVLDVTTTGRRCGRGQSCRNGEVHCRQVSAWGGRYFATDLEGDACLFVGQLEL